MCNTAMLQGVGVQAIVTEFLIQYADLIFSDKLQNVPNDTGRLTHLYPKNTKQIGRIHSNSQCLHRESQARENLKIAYAS